MRGTAAFLRLLGEELRDAKALPYDNIEAFGEHLDGAVNNRVLENALGKDNARIGCSLSGALSGHCGWKSHGTTGGE